MKNSLAALNWALQQVNKQRHNVTKFMIETRCEPKCPFGNTCQVSSPACEMHCPKFIRIIPTWYDNGPPSSEGQVRPMQGLVVCRKPYHPTMDELFDPCRGKHESTGQPVCHTVHHK